ncbi:MAG: nucleoid-associated protein [Saccharospirillaceae bacterium]|nr:nucleoid-associated protein [Pseudomonadales bacterium]NRB81352.1 nucleoid-associated protein [Saccharospirillaceae bacterium]
MTAFEFLIINETIAHEVFKRDINKQLVTPNTNNEIMELDSKSSSTLQERIVDAMTNDNHCLEMDVVDKSNGGTPSIIQQMFSGTKTTFTKNSKTLTENLAKAQQTRKIPGGALLILRGFTGSNRDEFVAIIKAEMQEGFKKENINGSISIEHLSDLFLTPQQKLYKIGLFIKNSDKLKAFVYDQNMTANETRSAAAYFYNDFLGCTFSPTDKKLTCDFYNHTTTFIEKLDVGEEVKLDLKGSLYSYLKVSKSATIKVADFSNQYFEKIHKDLYSEYMKENGMPIYSINKDLTYLKNKLRRRKVKFNSDVKIDAPGDTFDELVKIQGSKAGYTSLIIKGVIC